MCLIDACEQLAKMLEAARRERAEPDPPCRLCEPGDPCWFHRVPGYTPEVVE